MIHFRPEARWSLQSGGKQCGQYVILVRLATYMNHRGIVGYEIRVSLPKVLSVDAGYREAEKGDVALAHLALYYLLCTSLRSG